MAWGQALTVSGLVVMLALGRGAVAQFFLHRR